MFQYDCFCNHYKSSNVDVCQLYIDGIGTIVGKSTWYNRTWECKRFDTCKRIALNKALEVRIYDLKTQNSIKRLTQKKRKELMNTDLILIAIVKEMRRF